MEFSGTLVVCTAIGIADPVVWVEVWLELSDVFVVDLDGALLCSLIHLRPSLANS